MKKVKEKWKEKKKKMERKKKKRMLVLLKAQPKVNFYQSYILV